MASGSNTLHYVGATNYVENGVIGIWNKELTTHYGFSVETGDYLWTTDSESYLDAYGWGNAEHTWYYAYDHLYSVGVGGILYAYDLTTGDTAWTYTLNDVYGEPVTGQNWWGWITLIADGKIYLGTFRALSRRTHYQEAHHKSALTHLTAQKSGVLTVCFVIHVGVVTASSVTASLQPWTHMTNASTQSAKAQAQ